MEIYFAPLEGITGYTYRNAHKKYYEGVDKYFMPFISANHTLNFQTKEKKDFSPENNVDINIVPQILTNKAEYFVWSVRELKKLGYDEINLNLGCPASTVVSKRKGSGFLAFTKELDEFFYETFDALANDDVKISVKTRLGKKDILEMDEIMDIYNKYPLYELIIHPRIQKEMYSGEVHMEEFKRAYRKAKFPVCYNGDICSIDDFLYVLQEVSGIDRVMIGRGFLRNPELSEWISEFLRFYNGEISSGNFDEIIDEINGASSKSNGKNMNSKNKNSGKNSGKNSNSNSVGTDSLQMDLGRLRDFHDEVYNEYLSLIGPRNTLFKMKEIWNYMCVNFKGYDKEIKTIRKTTHNSEYLSQVKRILR